MLSEDSDMNNTGSRETTPTTPNFRGVDQPQQVYYTVPYHPYAHPNPGGSHPHSNGHPAQMAAYPYSYPYGHYPVMTVPHPNALVAHPPPHPSVAAAPPQGYSSIAPGQDQRNLDREASATPSDTTGVTSDAETTTTTEINAEASRARKRKRQEQAGNAKGKGKGRSIEDDSSHDVPDQLLLQHMQTQFAQISERLDRISYNTQTSDARPQQLTSSDEVLQQLLKGFQETNEILRGIGNKSKETEDIDGAMNVDSFAGGLANVKIKMTPATRPQESIDLAHVVRSYFKQVFQGHIENCDQVDRYCLTQGPSCTIDTFRLDLEAPPNAAWNKSARSVFVAAITHQKAADLLAFKPTVADLNRLFISNFRNTCSKYRWAQKTRLEQEVIKQEHRRAERKRWLYYRRIKAAECFQDTKRHIPMISAYGWEGMSTDESDHENGSGGPGYLALTKQWRNPNATTCLRTLDALHRDIRFKANCRVTPGAHPHRRERSLKPSKSAPVPNLPAGLYNPEWLIRQPDIVKEDLRITDTSAYDFSHTAGIEDISRVNHGKFDSVHPYV